MNKVEHVVVGVREKLNSGAMDGHDHTAKPVFDKEMARKNQVKMLSDRQVELEMMGVGRVAMTARASCNYSSSEPSSSKIAATIANILTEADFLESEAEFSISDQKVPVQDIRLLTMSKLREGIEELNLKQKVIIKMNESMSEQNRQERKHSSSEILRVPVKQHSGGGGPERARKNKIIKIFKGQNSAEGGRGNEAEKTKNGLDKTKNWVPGNTPRHPQK